MCGLSLNACPQRVHVRAVTQTVTLRSHTPSMLRHAVKSLARLRPPRLPQLLSRRSDVQLPSWTVGCGAVAVAVSVAYLSLEPVGATKSVREHVPENPGAGTLPTSVAASTNEAMSGSMAWLKAPVFSPLQPVTLTNPTKPANAEELLKSASSASAYPLFRIRSHNEMVESLLKFCQGLSSGRYFGTTGIHARTLQAPKGEGKTTILRAFAAVCQSMFPDVIPVYISLANFRRSKALRTSPVDEVVLDQLILHGVLKREEITGDPYFDPTVLISDVLERSNQRVLLLVDEFDELYRVDRMDEPELTRIAKDSMGSLSAFANLTTGRVGVVACGSTASLRKLLACTPGTDRSFYDEFPNLRGAPHLNGTKFSRFVVTPSTSVDLSVARAVLEAQSTTVKEGTVRLAAFIGGSNPRAIANTIEAGFDARSIRSPLQTDETRRRMNSFDGAFLAALMDRLWERNKALLESLLRPGSHLPSAVLVMHTPWENRFSPLKLSECISIFAEVAAKHDPDLVAYKDPRDAVDVLCDLGYLTQLHYHDEVFPSSLGQVFVCRGVDNSDAKLFQSWALEVGAQIGTPLASVHAKATRK